MNADNLLKEGRFLMKGALAEFAPQFLRGALSQMLSNLSVDEAVLWVNEDKSLFGEITPKYRAQIKALKLRKMDWLTSGWCIDATSERSPQIASLFLNWPKGREWLDRQTVELKTAFVSE